MSERSRKSMVIYEDMIDAVRNLPPETANEVLFAIFDYGLKGVEPTDGHSINAAFVNVYRKRIDNDFVKYEQQIKQRSEAGAKHKGNQYTRRKEQLQSQENGAEWNEMERNGTSVPTMERNGTNGTDNDNVSTKVDIKERNINVSKESASALSLQDRQQEFWEELKGYIPKYGYEMIKQFFAYWSEEEQNKKNPKMRREREKTWNTPRRLARWSNTGNLITGNHGKYISE